MTYRELDAWERKENVLEVLTSLEFGAWLNRRDKNKEALERKHGEWIIQNGMVVCSECFEPNFETNYCPNCGAEMRERRE